MARIVASIEARMGSTRLPGKVLADVCGKPALTRLLNRLQQCSLLDDIVLATSTDQRDDILYEWAVKEGIQCHRGSEEDVLLRVVDAHRKMDSDIVVEICGDMILLDPEIVDLGIKTFTENDTDVLTTTVKSSYPIGIDVLVFNFKDLEQIENTVHDIEVREHVSLYFFQNPEKYRIMNLMAPASLEAPGYRFILDYAEDLEFIRAVYSRLEPLYGNNFMLHDILALLKREPQLIEINRHCEEKAVF